MRNTNHIMVSEKNIGLSFRVTPSFKKLLETAAARERRSLTNMMQVALEEYCERKGIVADSQSVASEKAQ